MCGKRLNFCFSIEMIYIQIIAYEITTPSLNFFYQPLFLFLNILSKENLSERLRVALGAADCRVYNFRTCGLLQIDLATCNVSSESRF